MASAVSAAGWARLAAAELGPAWGDAGATRSVVLPAAPVVQLPDHVGSPRAICLARCDSTLSPCILSTDLVYLMHRANSYTGMDMHACPVL